MVKPREGAALTSVPRERLISWISASAEPIIVISGLAGSGKSTLAAQWLQHDGARHAVIRATPALNDPASLARMVATSLDASGHAADVLLDAATAAEPTFSSTLLPGISAVLQSRRRPFNLVIDDVHLLTKQQCRAILRTLATSVPEGSRLVLLTREEVPDWLARLRSEGVVLEVAPDDLAFDFEEARALFSGMGLRLPDDEIQQAVADSEGWAVGLYLTALARQGNGAAARRAPVTAASRSHRFLVDYVRTQVLDEFDDDRRRFLMETSILEELDPALCEEVTRRPDASEILADLQGRLQLVIPADGQNPARYHHLLGQALQTELERWEPALVPRLHERAAAWYERAGETDAAIRHAKAAGNLRLAGDLMWARLVECIASGRPDRLRAWLEDLTREQIAAERWLSLAAAWLAMQTADTDGIHRWALHCEVFAGVDWQERAPEDEYAAALAVLWALIGSDGLSTMADLAEGGFLGLRPDHGLRAAAAFLWGVALTLMGDRVAGDERLRTAEILGRSLDAPVSIADSLSLRGLLDIINGNADEGIRLIGEAGAVMNEFHLERLATSVHSVSARALMLAMRGDKRAARTTLGTARRMMSITESVAPWYAVFGRLVQARVAILLGDGAMARTLIDEARGLMNRDLEGSLMSSILASTAESLSTVRADGISAGSLTAAELRVLQFLPSHLTFPKIGEHLFLSTNTVKTHALAIYRKLGVTSRAQAVDRARTLGLVERPVVG